MLQTGLSRGFHFYDRELETLSRCRLQELQVRKLRSLLHELEANAFYREKLESAGLVANSVRDLSDLPRLPFTTKYELVETQRSFPPFGKLLTYPRTRYPYLHQTSGTSGNPLIWLDTQEDWETWVRCWGHVFRGAGVTEEDIVFLAYSFGPYVSHWAAMDGARRIGALCISGAGMNSLQRLDQILRHRATVVVCTPTYALHMAEAAKENGIDLASSAVRITIHAGEPGASVPHIRKCIEDAWGASCFDHAGATEVGAWAFDCQARSGGPHLNEAEFIFEVVDPESGALVPEYECGELVITTIGRAGMPVVRYRTGDRVVLTRDACACGRTFARIPGGVLGRADDMLIVRGVNMYPSAIDNVVRSVPAVLEYEVEVRRVKGMDDLLLKLELYDPTSFPATEQALSAAFRQLLNIRVEFQQVPANSLPRYEAKARRYKRVD